jgi:hypothetical protein
MTDVINRTSTSLALPEIKNAFLEYTAEGGGLFGELIKFVKGKWLHGDDEIPLGTEYAAEMDQLARGWVRWDDGKPVDHRLVFVRDGKKIAEREELGFNDKSEWEKDENGQPKDPWQEQSYLPLVHCETDENFCWVFGSHGAKKASQKLTLAYWKRGLSQLPIVSLRADRYKHPTYGWTDVPILKVERWQNKDGVTPMLVPAQASKLPQREDPISSGLPAKAKANANNTDLSDEILF